MTWAFIKLLLVAYVILLVAVAVIIFVISFICNWIDKRRKWRRW